MEAEVWRYFLVREIGADGKLKKEITVETPEEAVDLVHALYDLLGPGDPGVLVIEYKEINSNQQQRVFFNPRGMGLRAKDWRAFLDGRRSQNRNLGEGV